MNLSDSEIIADLMRKVEELTSTPSAFLPPDDIAVLTGRKNKTKQVETLRQMGVPFFVNGLGYPVVARSAIEGSGASKAEPKKKKWVPDVLKK